MVKLGRIRRDHAGVPVIIEGDVVIEAEGSIVEPASLKRTDREHRLDAVEFLPPVEPRLMLGAGVNFPGKNLVRPGVPSPSLKPVSGLAAHGTPIELPSDFAGRVIYEAECVAVLGRRCDAVTVDEAADAILGYACANDISHRGWRARDLSIWRAKGLPGFSPIGPWIDTDFDPSAPDTVMRLVVDGDLIHETALADMFFPFADVIAAISEYVPLGPGDLIWSGTFQSHYAEPNQEVTVEIPGIGRLVNRSILSTRF